MKNKIEISVLFNQWLSKPLGITVVVGLLLTGCSKGVNSLVQANDGYDHASAMIIASRVATADTAVVVSVDSTEAALETNEYNDQLIRTTVSGHVSEVLKGDSTQKSVSFVVDGGVVGTQRMIASDMPSSISKGNRFVVILKHPNAGRSASARFEVSGRKNGILPIASDADLADFKASLVRFQ